MTDLYVYLLDLPDEKIHKRIYNAGYENYTVSEIAGKVRSEVGTDIKIIISSTDDMRSYHISSDKIKRELGFRPKHSVEDAIRDLIKAFADGRVPDPMDNLRYYNIKTMKAINLK